MNKCAYKPDCPWYDGTKCNSPNDHTYNECDYDRGIFPEREEEQREQNVPDTNAGDTISRQAAIDAIRKASDELYENIKKGATFPQRQWFDGMAQAQSILENLSSAQLEQRWIPVTERLPEDMTRVLVTIYTKDKGYKVRSSYYSHRYFNNDNGDSWKVGEAPLLAWMPMPEPYKEKQK